MVRLPFLMPTLLLCPGLGLAGEYQKENPQAKEGNDWVKKSMEMTAEGGRGRGRPKMTWEKVVERDMKVRGLMRNDAKDGVKWRALSWGAKG